MSDSPELSNPESTKRDGMPPAKEDAGRPDCMTWRDWIRDRQTVLLCVILFALVAATYLPSLRNGFTNFDDELYVTANTQVQRGVTWDGFIWAFTHTVCANWHPLTCLSHMLDCQLFGLRPWGHHLTSLLLHAANSVLLFLVFLRLTGATWRSFVVAALFGLHPLHVESVAWISERKDVLSTFFWTLTLLAYARFAEASKKPERHGALAYAIALVCFALGLMSKPMLVTVPFVLLLLDYWPLRRWQEKGLGKLVLEKTPFFLLTAISSAVTFAVQAQAGAVQVALPLTARLENTVVSYCRYLGKLFHPANLCAFYPRPDHWPMPIVFLSLVLLGGITVFVAMRWRRQPYLAVGWFWYIGILVPVVGLVQVGDQSMADRYTYVPAIGIFVSLIWGLHELTRRRRYQQAVLSGVATTAVILCVPITCRQISTWKDGEALFRQVLAVTHNNYIALNNLGDALVKKGRVQDGISEFQKAVQLHPDRALAYFNLGVALDKQEHYDAAVAQYLRAVKLQPDYAKAYYNLGVTLGKLGRPDEAIEQYVAALKVKPAYAEAHYNLGVALEKKGYPQDAIGQYLDALKANPEYADAHNNLGVLLARQGHPEEGLSEIVEALRLRPGSPDYHYNLGNALIREKRVDEAIVQFQQVVRLQPHSSDARNNLGVLLTRRRRYTEAINQFEEAIKLKPGFSEARTNLAIARRLMTAPIFPPASPPNP